MIETEIYYKKFKHLPDVPSANEIAVNGLDIGKLVSIQMMKIEELTIHLVSLQKKLNEIEAKQNKESENK